MNETPAPRHHFQNEPQRGSRWEASVNERRLLVPIVFALLLIALAFILDTPAEIFRGMLRILSHPSNLLSDYMVVGSVAAAFFNVGLMTILTALMIKINQVPVSGAILAAIFTISGFSFFGKNLFNSIPITIGVYLYSLFDKTGFKQQIILALYGTALGPLVSYIAFASARPFWRGTLYGYSVGIVCGFLLPPLAAAFVRFHQGFSLYNVGFTAGVIGMLAIGVLRFFDWEISNQNIVYSGLTTALVLLFYSLFLSLALFAFFLNGKNLHAYKALMKSSGRLASDFVGLYGYGTTLFNMSVMGLIALSYALLVGGRVNGPILGGVLTVMGFGAFGKHPRNVIPIFIGVLTLGFFTPYDHTSTTAVLAGLFGTTLAPIAGYFGAVPGILAGFIHMTMVLNVGVLHSGVNLYNNGFSGGFVAAILVPVLEIVQMRHLLPKQLWEKFRKRHTQTKIQAGKRVDTGEN